VTAIAGHRDAVVDGVTGLLAAPAALGTALARALAEPDLRARLGAAALARATTFTWEATAAGTLSALARAGPARPARPAPDRRARRARSSAS
jgi:glycosyltransferase involved in cell wall biosynthesis